MACKLFLPFPLKSPKKNILIVISMLFILFSLLAVPFPKPVQGENLKASVSVDTVIMCEGETVEVRVTLADIGVLEGVTGISGGQFDLHFDNTRLEVLSVDKGEAIQEDEWLLMDNVIDPNGLLAVAWLSTYEDPADPYATEWQHGDGELLKITFAINETGSSFLEVQDLFLKDQDVQDISFNLIKVNNGSITFLDSTSLMVGSATGNLGETVEVPVSLYCTNKLEDVTGISGGQFQLVYDSTKLEVLSVVKGNLLQGNEWLFEYNPQFADDTLAVAWLSFPDTFAPTDWLHGDGELFKITFQFKEEGTSLLEPQNLYLKDQHIDDINMNSIHIINGEITVHGLEDECFIATAVFGSKLEPTVVMLRQFRDAYLLTNKTGTWLVKAYYNLSPPLASLIAGNEILRALAGIVLLPFIGVAFLLMHKTVIILFVILSVGYFLTLKVRGQQLV